MPQADISYHGLIISVYVRNDYSADEVSVAIENVRGYYSQYSEAVLPSNGQ